MIVIIIVKFLEWPKQLRLLQRPLYWGEKKNVISVSK